MILGLIGAIAMVPILIQAADRGTRTLQDQYRQERLRNSLTYFANGLSTGLKSRQVCTQNLVSNGVVGRVATTVQNQMINLRLGNGSGQLQTTDLTKSLGSWTQNIEIDRMRLDYGLDRSASTKILYFKAEFYEKKEDGTRGGALRSLQVPVLVETDNANRIVGCQFSKATQVGLIEDQLCRNVHGPTYQFEMKDSSCVVM